MFHEKQGEISRQAHVGIPEGMYEDEHGRGGFYGRVTHLYRKHPPTNWKKIEGPCRPQAFNMLELPMGRDPWQAVFALANDDVRIGFMQPRGTMPYFFRNADGDNIYFVHQGQGTLETDFGNLKYDAGDYIVIPKGTTHRFQTSQADQKYLVIESTTEVNLPQKGLLGQHALFDIAMLETPRLEISKDEPGDFDVVIKRQNQLTKVTYGFNPLDVVGWKGDLTAVKINIKDFRPVVSHRYHLAPSVHTTFQGQGFVVCSFVPRPFETDTAANRVPFYHRNIDCDEVIFYHDGDFFSRKNMGAGMVTFHPFGIHHGPHPGSSETAAKKTMTNEYAVMVDTFHPLNPTSEASQCEWKEYHLSWRE